jgi:hypothetical protein
MKISNIDNMVKGWFVGNFQPTLFKTNDVEVALKRYCKGVYENTHFHKVATEITVVASGCVKMNGVEYHAGDIVIMEPHESTDFEALEENTQCVVVKIPGANNDKFEC